jgi:hypothetical protein
MKIQKVMKRNNLFQNNFRTLVQIDRIPPILKTNLMIGTYNNVSSIYGWEEYKWIMLFCYQETPLTAGY